MGWLCGCYNSEWVRLRHAFSLGARMANIAIKGRRWGITPPHHCLPMTLDNAQRREWYARRRVRHLRERLSELPDEVTPELMAKLRRISVSAFRAGEVKQTLLSPFALGSAPPPPTGDAESVSSTAGRTRETS